MVFVLVNLPYSSMCYCFLGQTYLCTFVSAIVIPINRTDFCDIPNLLTSLISSFLFNLSKAFCKVYKRDLQFYAFFVTIFYNFFHYIQGIYSWSSLSKTINNNNILKLSKESIIINNCFKWLFFVEFRYYFIIYHF